MTHMSKNAARGLVSRLRFCLRLLLASLCSNLMADDVLEERSAYFGDLHLHTTYSLDGYMAKGVLTTPDLAYRFARGEVIPYMGHTVQREWPLDFLAVTDHAEYLGVLQDLDNPDDPRWKDLRLQLANPTSALARSPLGHILLGDREYAMPESEADPKIESTRAWQATIRDANQNYRPGRFTTFIGFEWTAMPEGKTSEIRVNLHRNVIFRGARAPAPFSAIDSRRPEDLWTYLEAARRHGMEALAIPHNSNASGGLMFDWNDSDGRPIDAAYARRRSFNEPLVEIGQGKGVSETHPSLSPTDEFANFEIIDALFIGPGKSEPKGSYVRDAYGRGLIIGQRTGVNPYKFGVEGGSDYHNGLSTSGEGSLKEWIKGTDPADGPLTTKDVPESLGPIIPTAPFTMLMTGSGHLTGVWAERNTRESIYDALRRKETFATSGTRIRVRFFGSWNFSKENFRQKNWMVEAYSHGVTMGQDMPARPATGGSPTFLVWAVKDPSGANLDRIQIVKLWLVNGEYKERIFDVVAVGDREPDPVFGRLPSVGNSVDEKHGTYTNTLGASELKTVWRDPDFDPASSAVYYVRVLEIPTPRWSTILAAKAGVPLPAGVPASIQERAWTTPIWYSVPARPDQ